MLKARKRVSILLALTLAGLALLSASCADKRGSNEPPLELPFDAGRVGSTTDFEVRIAEKREYLLSVVFLHKATPEESERVGRILGMARETDSGKWVEDGVPAEFIVRISKQPGDREIFNKLVGHAKTMAEYGGRGASIARVQLDPGQYSVKLEYVRGAPELAALPARLSFSDAHHGK